MDLTVLEKVKLSYSTDLRNIKTYVKTLFSVMSAKLVIGVTQKFVVTLAASPETNS